MVRQKNGTKKIKDKRTADADMGFGEWGGYMEAKRAKLMDQFHETNIEKISNIFQGIAIHVNGLTKPPIEVLKNLMAAHGGLFHSYQVSSTTHIIASNLANVKIKHLGPVPIIKPSWITDSVELGKLLDYKRYVLYTNQSLSQPKLEFPLVNKPSSTVDSNITRELTLIKKDMINDTGENLKLVSSREDEKQGENLSQSMTNNLKHSVASTDQSDDFEKSFFISNLGGSSSVVNNKLIQNQNENKKEGNLEGLPITAEELYTIHSTHEKDIEEYKTSEKNLLFKARASTKTAADPSFLGEFYSNSRLHLISTLGAEFKQLVNDLRERSNGNFPAKEKLLLAGKRTCGSISGSVIMHIDMDCFFVSVSLRNHSELHGKPVAIAHARYAEIANIKPEQKANREQEFALYGERLPVGVTSRVDKIDVLSSLSEIASCSYEARKYGIRNGMFLGQAIKMCPDLKTLPYDFELAS